MIRGKRKALSSVEIDVASRTISQQLFKTEFFQAASIIFLYAALPHEVQTSLIASQSRKQSKRVAYPSISPQRHGMNFYVVEDESELIVREYGVVKLYEPNPAKHPLILPNEETLMIVPGMAFDYQKNRLGYGGGYYDHFLGNNGIKSIGIGFDFSLFLELPVGPFDQSLDGIVTEENLLL